MPITNFNNGFAHGVNIRGLPLLNAYGGSVIWLDSGNGSDQNKGTFDRPMGTLNGAYDKVAANNGDIIMVKPGHAENVSSATTQVCDVAGVTVMGLGVGSDRPTFTYTATAGSFEVDAANTYLSNLRFVSSISAVVVGMNIDADYCTVDRCEFNFDATGDDFVIMIDVDDVNHCTIQYNEMRAEAATAGADHAIRIDTADWCRIIGNEITGDFAAGPITGEGAASTQILIADNVLYNDDTAFAQNGIDLNVACTGVVARNMLTGLQATGVANLLDPGSCLNVENYGCNAIDELAIVIGGTASA